MASTGPGRTYSVGQFFPAPSPDLWSIVQGQSRFSATARRQNQTCDFINPLGLTDVHSQQFVCFARYLVDEQASHDFLPDLGQSKNAVLHSLTTSSQKSYGHATATLNRQRYSCLQVGKSKSGATNSRTTCPVGILIWCLT